MRDFTQQTGLKRQYDREQVATVQGLNSSPASGTIKSLDIDDFDVLAEAHGIYPEVSRIITSTIREYERQGGVFFADVKYGEFYDHRTGKPALLQTSFNKYGQVILNVNSKLLGGHSIEEIDGRIAATKSNLPQSLREATIHECGHAKAYYGKTEKEIETMNTKLAANGVPGISSIAEEDGAECIAEVEVLLSRGEEVPVEAMELYEKYTRGVGK